MEFLIKIEALVKGLMEKKLIEVIKICKSTLSEAIKDTLCSGGNE